MSTSLAERRAARAGWLLPLALIISGCSAARVSPQDSSTGPESSAAQPSSQSVYQYSGCRDENGGCPRLLTLACALRTIASKYNTCAKHEDCVEAALDPKCSGAGTCPPYFVNRESKQSFETDAQREIDRYCRSGDCSYSGLCGSFGPVEAYCAQAHCTFNRLFGEAAQFQPRLR